MVASSLANGIYVEGDTGNIYAGSKFNYNVDTTVANPDFMVAKNASDWLYMMTPGMVASWINASIDHNVLTNTHNLTTDIDHNALTNYVASEHVALGDIDHGLISGLAGDDHTQYLLASGSRALTGDWDAGNFIIRTGEIRSTAGANVGLKLSNVGNSNFIFIEDSTEHIGFNVATPTRPMDVFAGGLFTYTLMKLHGSGAYCWINFLDAGTTNQDMVRIGCYGDNLMMYAGGSERFRLLSGGGVSTGGKHIVKDQDNMASDSNIHLVTQQSVKKYVDDSVLASTIDHGGLAGLGDDDHTQYVLTDGTRTFFNLALASPLLADDGRAIIYNDALGSLGWGVAGGGGGNAASVVTATWGRFLDDVAATNVQSALDLIDDYAVEVVQGSEPSSTYAGMVWIDTDGAGTSARSLINDSDEDTWVNCETSTDNDVIKMGANSVLIYNASVDSTYPMLQILPYDHGNVQIAFDAYFDRDTAAWYSCSATANFSIAKNDTQEALQILSNTGDAVGSPIGAFNKTVLKAKASGEVTMPNQPAFLFELASIYQFVPEGINLTIPFNTEIFDQSSDFNTSTYTFTAPVTGRYHLDTCVRPYTVDSECSYIYIQIVTSNRNHSFLWDVANVMNTDGRAEMVLSMMADMDEADTAFVRIRQDNGASQAQINLQTYFGGHLAC
jgi:hypothetical protein